MTASFIMSELMIRTLSKLFFEEIKSSLLQNSFMNNFSSMIFYQNDILDEHKLFQNQFTFLKNHFLSRIEWSKLKLSFKKLYLFQSTIKVLRITHIVKEEIKILSDQCEKIANFFNSHYTHWNSSISRRHRNYKKMNIELFRARKIIDSFYRKNKLKMNCFWTTVIRDLEN
jgi:hypothetical protein